jgi:hypothetical protein
MPIWISPDLTDSGVGIRGGITVGCGIGGEDPGLASGVGSPLTPTRYGCIAFLYDPIWLGTYISSLEILLLLKAGFSERPRITDAFALGPVPPDVLGRAVGMTGGRTIDGVDFGGGGGGSGRSR